MNTGDTARRDAFERALRIQAENIVIDSLCPTFTCEMMMTPAMEDLARSLHASGKTRSFLRTALAEHLVEAVEKDPDTRQAYIAYWNRAGVTAASSTLYDSYPPANSWNDVLIELALGDRLIDGLEGAFVSATSAASIERAYREGRHAVIYNLQNAEPIGDNFDRVDILYNLGVRIIQVAYNLRNRFGDGCLERRDGGLSRFGQALVEKLNRRRILIDLSHCSDQTSIDVIAESQVPVAFTHTAARAISGHARAKTDEALRAIAEKGGYIGILIVPFMVLPPEGDPRAQALGLPAGWASLDAVVDHVAHVLNVAGSDAVGIGTDWGKPYYQMIKWVPDMTREKTSDFDWVGWRPQDRFDPNVQTRGMESWDLLPNLTATMLARGIPEETVVKIAGGNFLRVFREVCG